jgi:hypothetical protein
LWVTIFGKLKVSEPQITVTGWTAAYQSQIRRGLAHLRGWAALDAMIGDLLMSHVAGFFPGHVAAAAVRLIRVVLADESRLSVAGKTSASKIGDPLFG